MELIIMTSPVSSFSITVCDENGDVVTTTQTFYCNLIPHLNQIISNYEIDQAYVAGPKNYVSQVIQELKEIYTFPISDRF